jgi:lipid A 3-O-deacylase
MFSHHKHWKMLAATLALLAAQSTAYALDSVSAEFATGNKTKMVRFGAQWDWNKHWFQSNGTHLGGYWDLTIAKWHGTQFQNVSGSVQNLTDIGITQVVRFQKDSKLGFYAELGLGAHRLSDLYNNDGRRLSTRFQFGDHLGFGYVFSNKIDVALKFQHFSNGGYKQPNNGVNFGVAKISYPF